MRDLPNVVLRDFSTGRDDSSIFIVPPQAGHHSSIADYGKGQSLAEALVLAGAPIDFHAGDGKIKTYTSLLPMPFYESMVAAGNGVLDGKFLLTGFKMLDPAERYLGEFSDLFFNADNASYLKRYRRFRDWYEYTQNLPGAFYLQVIADLFKGNRLIKGKLTVLDRKVDLHNIRCPLYLIAGSKDEITPEKQVFNTEHYVSSKNILKIAVPAVHIGVFMGTTS